MASERTKRKLNEKKKTSSSPFFGLVRAVDGSKEQNIGIYGYIGTWILRKYRKISVDILTKISVMQKLTKIL